MRLNDATYYVDSGLPVPDDIRKMRETYRCLAELAAEPAPEPPPTPEQAHVRMVAATVAAAGKGLAKLPDVSLILKAAAAEDAHGDAVERARLQAEVLKAAQSQAAQDLVDAITGDGVAIITALAGHLEQMMAELRTDVAPKVRHLTTVDALRAGDDVRAAYTRSEEIVAEYVALRRTHVAITDALGCRFDTPPRFLVFRNGPDLWPTSQQRDRVTTPPWPEGDSRAFLFWCVDTPGAELWCPTPAERDARWLEAFPDSHAAKTAGIAAGRF